MNKNESFFYTDWASMTLNDWIGTLLTVVVFVLMCVLYVHVLRPGNRNHFESQKSIPLDDSDVTAGDRS